MNRVQLDDAVGAVRNLIPRDAVERLMAFQRDYVAKHKREPTHAELVEEADRVIRMLRRGAK
jgi:hypothetical protein